MTDKEFWLGIRRALLVIIKSEDVLPQSVRRALPMIVSVIEKRYNDGDDIRKNHLCDGDHSRRLDVSGQRIGEG